MEGGREAGRERSRKGKNVECPPIIVGFTAFFSTASVFDSVTTLQSFYNAHRNIAR